VQEQVAKGIHLQQNCCISRPLVALLEKLSTVMPEGIERFFFNGEGSRRAGQASEVPRRTGPVGFGRLAARWRTVRPRALPHEPFATAAPTAPSRSPAVAAGTGAEAVESAIKLARHETGRQNIIHFKGGFHGRSLTTLAATTSKTAYRVGYGPLPSGFHQAPFPYSLHFAGAQPSPAASSAEDAAAACCEHSIQYIKELLKETTAPSDTAAILLEPILGEGGYVVPPPGFFKQLRALCDEHGILLIADEVQSVSIRSGVGRAEHRGRNGQRRAVRGAGRGTHR
jgi:4-aminobutyrate aminotransferase-like enzyme